MKINLITKVAAVGIVLSTLVSCTHYIYVSRSIWQEKPVVADGKPAEWKVPLKYYDEKSKLQYSVSNDLHNLYFCIRATDQQTQTKMFRAGLQVWIDTTGKNEHEIGILFPLSSSVRKADPNEADPSPKTKPDVAGIKNKFKNGYKEMELAGFKTGINGISPIKNSNGILASINWDSTDIMTYEAVVPFNTFYKDSISPRDSLKLMGISIVLSGLKRPETTPENNSGGGGSIPGAGGMRGGGGGGMHGGGGGGHRGGGGGHSKGAGAGSDYLFETNTIKKTIQLSGAKQKPSAIEYTK